MPQDCSNEKTLLQDVKFCQGKKSLPGTKKRVYIADIRDIVKFPKLADRSAEPPIPPLSRPAIQMLPTTS